MPDWGGDCVRLSETPSFVLDNKKGSVQKGGVEISCFHWFGVDSTDSGRVY